MNNSKSKFIDKILNYRHLKIYFAIYLSIFFLNILYNLVNIFIFPELSIKFKTFLFYPEDRFADFFKFGAAFSNFKLSPELLNIGFIDKYLTNNPYLSDISIYHQPPLPFSIYVLIGFISQIFNIFYFFFIFVFFLLISIARIIIKHSHKYKNEILLCFFSSYPLIFMVDRGHILSLIAFIFLLLSIIYISSNKNRYGILFMALAICMRPTFFIFSLIFLTVKKSNLNLFFNNIIKLVIVGAIISFVLYVILNNQFYTDYNLQNILNGLNIYKINYIENSGGQNYGTSFYFFISLFTNSPLIIGTFIALTLLANIFLFFQIPFRNGNLALHLFLLINLVFIVTPVNADYYLLLYFIPLYLVLASRININDAQSSLIVIISSMLIAPKNYYIEDITVGSSINVIIILISSVFISLNLKNLLKSNT